MTKLRELISIRCPIAEAQARMIAFFERRRDSDGTTRLPLRIRIDDKGPLAGLALEHDVNVNAAIGKDDQHLNDVVRIRWAPSGGGAFPEFEGTIVAWAEQDPNVTLLELQGTYQPPGGTGGEIFDETLGRTIAQRTARALLDDVARSIGAKVEAAS
ncbi:MAG: hypothetical protein JO199_09020 [Candidatus Eremiobacteraeota bacterium]|nr:hypothetical protein [Candidatus Eremiobacteraeota bacterium]